MSAKVLVKPAFEEDDQETAGDCLDKVINDNKVFVTVVIVGMNEIIPNVLSNKYEKTTNTMKLVSHFYLICTGQMLIND